MSQLVQDPEVSLDEIANFLSIVSALHNKSTNNSELLLNSEIITKFMNLHSIKKLDFFTSKPEYEKFMMCSTCFKVGDSVFPSQEQLVKHIQMEHNRQGAEEP